MQQGKRVLIFDAVVRTVTRTDEGTFIPVQLHWQQLRLHKKPMLMAGDLVHDIQPVTDNVCGLLLLQLPSA
jgi:hypothetical protein